MVIPAIFALTAANYEGKDRALAYALIGATVAIAVAAGPLIGGWVTTNYSWRWVFAGETVVVIILLLFRGNLGKGPESRASTEDGLRRGGVLGGRPRPDRLRNSDEQHRGADHPACCTHNRRHRDHPLGFSVVPFPTPLLGFSGFLPGW